MGLIPEGTRREWGLDYSGVIFQHLPSPVLWNWRFLKVLSAGIVMQIWPLCPAWSHPDPAEFIPKSSPSSSDQPRGVSELDLWGHRTHLFLIKLNLIIFKIFRFKIMPSDIRWHIAGWLNDMILSKKAPVTNTVLPRWEFKNFMWIPDFSDFPLLFLLLI